MTAASRAPYTPPGGPPELERPSPEIFAAMGEAGIRAMIREFYEELHRSPIAGLFSPDIQSAAERSAAFFIGLLGGPPLYHERHGPPRMRARHLPFTITPEARDTWLACFERVLTTAPERHGFPAEHLPGFRRFLTDFSAWMINTRA